MFLANVICPTKAIKICSTTTTATCSNGIPQAVENNVQYHFALFSAAAIGGRGKLSLLTNKKTRLPMVRTENRWHFGGNWRENWYEYGFHIHGEFTTNTQCSIPAKAVMVKPDLWSEESCSGSFAFDNRDNAVFAPRAVVISKILEMIFHHHAQAVHCVWITR